MASWILQVKFFKGGQCVAAAFQQSIGVRLAQHKRVGLFAKASKPLATLWRERMILEAFKQHIIQGYFVRVRRWWKMTSRPRYAPSLRLCAICPIAACGTLRGGR